MTRRQCDVLYCEGPGDIVAAYKSWKGGGDHLSETGVTFSGQVFEFCRLENLTLYAVSCCARAETLTDDRYIVVNKPRWFINIPKIGYDLTLLLHSLRLLVLVLRIRPKVILMNSGVTGWGALSLFRLTGAKIVPVLHNTLWPEGYPPSGLIAAARRRIEGFLWRRCVWLTIVVSPAARRQVEIVSGVCPKPILVMRPSFPAATFADAPPTKDFRGRPFRVMFAGRVEENKGVFDLLSMAEGLRAGSNGTFEFCICGDGPALGLLRQQIKARGLQQEVKVYGRLNRPDLVARYLDSHLVIVPTRSSFPEGFAMVVAEAILLLRPVLTSHVVPSAEVLGSAVIIAQTDDVQSYIASIEALSKDEARYLHLVEESKRLRSFILDDSTSFLASLRSLKAMGLSDGLRT
jgi:glycogen synthase